MRAVWWQIIREKVTHLTLSFARKRENEWKNVIKINENKTREKWELSDDK